MNKTIQACGDCDSLLNLLLVSNNNNNNNHKSKTIDLYGRAGGGSLNAVNLCTSLHRLVKLATAPMEDDDDNEKDAASFSKKKKKKSDNTLMIRNDARLALFVSICLVETIP